MWVDIFPTQSSELAIPPPIDISPRKAKNYELRVVVWSTSEIKPASDENMSDIFIKG